MMLSSKQLHPAFWLWIPLIYLCLQSLAEIFLSTHVIENLVSENGLIEWLEFLIASCAFIVAVQILRRLSYKQNKFLFIWVSIAAFGLLYIAGEEISWGQWILQWQTPEHWAKINDQNETNLHNVSFWLDQKPRALLEIGVVVGGLILPFLHKLNRFQFPQWLLQISPKDTVVLTALLFLIVKIVDFIGDHGGPKFFIRPSEVRECLVYYFVFVYLLWFKKASL